MKKLLFQLSAIFTAALCCAFSMVMWGVLDDEEKAHFRQKASNASAVIETRILQAWDERSQKMSAQAAAQGEAIKQSLAEKAEESIRKATHNALLDAADSVRGSKAEKDAVPAPAQNESFASDGMRRRP
ncbi:MAG: hypothetical protein GY822_07280 [Deltaproteobacteria bacterium]|nr:hypothetical protein [Deltaproteobacteria bacterium]